MLVSVAIVFVVSTALSGGWLWAVARWSGVDIPIVDLLIIAGLCSALAPLPRAGWALASLIMALVIARTTDADPWPDTVLMIVGSNVIWLVTKTMLLGWT